MIAVGIVLVLFAGSSASGAWRTWLQWRNAPPFGTKDPQFGLDVSFYVFDLPWWRFVLGLRVRHRRRLPGARPGRPLPLRRAAPAGAVGERTTRGGPGAPVGAARACSCCSRRSATGSTATPWPSAGIDGRARGLHRAALHRRQRGAAGQDDPRGDLGDLRGAVLRQRRSRRTWLLPGVGVGLLVLSAVLVGGIYPALVQQFQVRPSEPDTRGAVHHATSSRHPHRLRHRRHQGAAVRRQDDRDRRAAAGRRRDDPQHPAARPVASSRRRSSSCSRSSSTTTSPTPSTSTATRSTGKERDAIVALREINLNGVPGGPAQLGQRPHASTPTASASSAALRQRGRQRRQARLLRARHPAGRASSATSSRASTSASSRRPTRSSVHRPAPSRAELDYPDDAAANGQQNYTYTGKGGVPIGSLCNKLLFATKFQETNILLSDRLNSESKILFERDPRDRVEKVAPWLTVDGDPYPAVVDGRMHVDRRRLHHLATATRTPRGRTLQEATTDTHHGPVLGRAWPSRSSRSTTSATRSRRPSTPTTAP